MRLGDLGFGALAHASSGLTGPLGYFCCAFSEAVYPDILPHFSRYCAATGGSLLVIGSAAGREEVGVFTVHCDIWPLQHRRCCLHGHGEECFLRMVPQLSSLILSL